MPHSDSLTTLPPPGSTTPLTQNACPQTTSVNPPSQNSGISADTIALMGTATFAVGVLLGAGVYHVVEHAKQNAGLSRALLSMSRNPSLENMYREFPLLNKHEQEIFVKFICASPKNELQMHWAQRVTHNLLHGKITPNMEKSFRKSAIDKGIDRLIDPAAETKAFIESSVKNQHKQINKEFDDIEKILSDDFAPKVREQKTQAYKIWYETARAPHVRAENQDVAKARSAKAFAIPK